MRKQHCIWALFRQASACGLVLFTFAAHAQTISLNSFYPTDSKIGIFAGGLSAHMEESQTIVVRQLINNPLAGDTGGILPGDRFLSLVYEFKETPGDNDLFSVVIFDATQGPVDGALEVFEQSSAAAGAVQIDLAPWLDRPLGVLVELIELDRRGGGTGSRVSISRMQQVADIADSDGDGMPDRFEEASDLDPQVDDSAEDLDGDGLSNLQEYLKGTDVSRTDSDGDSISDGLEVLEGLNPLDDTDCPSWYCGSVLNRLLPMLWDSE